MTNRIETIDTMRTLCTYLVILGHILVFFVPNLSVIPFKTDETLGYLQQLIYSFHIPAFFFISGLVYHNRQSIFVFIKSKFNRLMLPYFLVYLLMVMPTLMLMGIWKWENLYLILFNSESRHLWFLYTLTSCLIFVRLFDKVPKILGLIFGILIYFYGFKYFSLPYHFSSALVFVYLGVVWKPTWRIPYYLSIPLFILTFVYLKDYPLIQAFFGIMMLYEASHYLKFKSEMQFDLYLFHAMIIYLLFYYCSFLKAWPNGFVVIFVFFASLYLSKGLSFIKVRLMDWMIQERVYKK